MNKHSSWRIGVYDSEVELAITKNIMKFIHEFFQKQNGLK